ncbi:DUF4865 family protein [Streptomyces sp. ICBB 8177]|uniref:DUF4865 family protein n=1 Tax=Streptomyces sp. ICBB 8177 TaxID=563922 RepID=UPI000D67FFFC|nr:DUF4865 family protein [Streptomyces sp. ICBB 8177]PWI45441.1 DUF4865 domain-containing protein [Streptomyces sp. ICBB 8177]
MYAMQYEITLPADYDMGIIRRRVASRGPALDGFAGLGFKAYLVRDRADGSPVNAYAPFYLWHDTAGMNRFLWGGGGFQGIVRDFGRPVVRHWTGVGHEPGPDRAAVPTAAVRETEAVPEGADLAELADRELSVLRERAAEPGTHSVTLAIDPYRWELVRFTLRTDGPAAAVAGKDAEAGATAYDVLHLNRPGLDELPTGRHW